MKKLQYQEKAVDMMLEVSEKFLTSKRIDNKYMLLKATTGSGKTIIASKFMRKYLTEYRDTVFIWVSIGKGKLHEQSAKKLRDYLPENFNIILPDNALSKSSFTTGDILVINWETINTTEVDSKTGEKIYKNIIMRGGEEKSLRDIWKKTGGNGYDIVLIIDESHYNSSSQTSKEIVEMIKPIFILELTATPNYIEMAKKGYYQEISIDVEDIINEEAIKKSIKLNDFIEGDMVKRDEKSSEISLLVETAIRKREELLLAYKDLKIDYINPLCLIQLPNSNEGERVMEEVLQVLKRYNISIENKNLAIWLSGLTEEESNKSEIEKNNSLVDYLIFKQAVATGWDCPRASVLVKLREMGSEIFDLQTIGRILRMPELRYYKDDILNHGYIYTNSDNYTLESGGYPHILPQRQVMKEKHHDLLNIALSNEKVKKINNYRREYELGVAFKRIIENQTLEINIKDFNKIIITSSVDSLNLDKQAQMVIEHEITEEMTYVYTPEDVNRIFRRLLFTLKTPLYTTDVLSRLILNYLGEKFEGNTWLDIKKIALLNSELLVQAINKIKDEDKVLSEYHKEMLEFKFSFERYENGKETIIYNKNVYNIHFLPDKIPENSFEKYLENHDAVKYWIKNGDNGSNNLSIVYNEIDSKENETKVLREFYPDYIVGFKDNTLGIFEVKSKPDLKAQETKQKIKALEKYLETHKKLIGGLVQVEDGVVHKLSLHEKLK